MQGYPTILPKYGWENAILSISINEFCQTRHAGGGRCEKLRELVKNRCKEDDEFEPAEAADPAEVRPGPVDAHGPGGTRLAAALTPW